MTRFGLPLLVIACGWVLGCGPNRHLQVAGYTTEPQFDPNIRSVHIPTFKLNTFVANPYRGLDVDVTEAVVRELTARKSPIRIVSDPARADTELIGTIVQVNKLNYLYSVQGLSRETDVSIRVEFFWRDLRTGHILTNPRGSAAPEPVPPSFDPSIDPAPPKVAQGVVAPISIQGRGRFLPEIGESNTTATNTAVASIARQIVNLMEKPW